MKKPDGEAPAGWYEVLGERNSERFWDGTNWTSETRKADFVSQGSEPIVNASDNQKLTLGKFLFRNPVTSDWAFILYVVLVGLSSFSSIKQDVDRGLSIPIYVQLVGVMVTALWVYIISLLILVPRRIRDKRRGLLRDLSSQDALENRVGWKLSRKTFYILIAALVIIVVSFSFVNSSGKTDGDKYFEIEQRISAVVKDWNVAATPTSEAIRAISAGTMGAAEARRIAGDASSKFAIISNRLEEACSEIPAYDINANGQEGAIAKSYDALQVTCDLLPQESTEILLLINAQISPIATQATVDYHSNEIAKIITKRKDAIVAGLESLYPYMSDAQKANAERLKSALVG